MDAAYQDLASAFRLIAQDSSGDAASAVRSAVEQLQAAIDSGGANSDAIQQIRGTLGVAGKPLDASGSQRAPNNVPPAPNSPKPAASAGRVDVTQPNRDLTLLHPMMRDRAQKVLSACTQQQLPFRIFEAWRAPERQQYLYEQGRSRPAPNGSSSRL